MAVFAPPTVSDMAHVLPDTRGVQRRLFRYYGLNPRGLAVVKVGGVYTTIDNPTTDQLAAAGRDGTDYFLGGHVYSVTATVATALTAAGYTTTADPPGVSWSTYSGAFWGEMAGYEWGVL